MADSHSTGVEMIAAERKRQIKKEGWTLAHDDTHRAGELADVAACLAATEPIYVKRDQANQGYRYSKGVAFVTPWPYEHNAVYGTWHPWRRPEASRLAELVKAGALIAAEIDRLQRAESFDPSGQARPCEDYCRGVGCTSCDPGAPGQNNSLGG